MRSLSISLDGGETSPLMRTNSLLFLASPSFQEPLVCSPLVTLVSYKLLDSSAKEEVEEDEDIDLFGDSEDEEEAAEQERIKAERVAAYNAKKAAKEEKKGKIIAKSNIILDIKPWDDETDMKTLESEVR